MLKINRKKIIFFILAVALSTLAAGYKFYDSSHAMGLISANGGKARHPIVLEEGRNFYCIIATATVLPTFRGDAKIVLEGHPRMDYSIYNSEPVIDVGVHRHPTFQDGVFYGLQPRDRLAFWLVMRATEDTHPGDGKSGESHMTRSSPESVSTSCCPLDSRAVTAMPLGGNPGENLSLSFYNVKTNQPVLKIPIIFKGNGAGSHELEHH
jgi:hypothetical protein